MSTWFAGQVASGTLVLALPLALVAGLVSFFSPCVVPLLPGYLSYMSGVAVTDLESGRRGRLVTGSLLFVLGFSAVFVSAGALFGFAGTHLRTHQRGIEFVAGFVVIGLGLAFIGLVPFLQREVRVHAVPAVGLAVAPLLGALFGLGWVPCIGPTLSVVQLLAVTDNTGTAARGAILSLAYCLGLGVPFVLAALGFGRFMHAVAWFRRHQQAVTYAGGGMLVVVGVLLVTGGWDHLVEHLRTLVGGSVPAL